MHTIKKILTAKGKKLLQSMVVVAQVLQYLLPGGGVIHNAGGLVDEELVVGGVHGG